MIKEIEDAYNAKPKNGRQHYLCKTYEVYEIAQVKKIIQKRENKVNDPVLYLVPKDDMFDTILACHNNVGHKGKFFYFISLSN